MDKRKHLALLFLHSYQTWAGGVIYIINIVSTLKMLKDNSKPMLSIIYNDKSPIEDIKNIDYEYIQFIKINEIKNTTLKLLNNILIATLRISLNASTDLSKHHFDFLYPSNFSVLVNKNVKRIYWIPDFQEKHLPQLFSRIEKLKRTLNHQKIAHSKSTVIFSSQIAMNDFIKFYPKNNVQIFVAKFVSILPAYNHLQQDKVHANYNIKPPYFFVPNQFWEHKNHITVLKAILELKKNNTAFTVCFSGSLQDFRNKKYINTLLEFIKNNELDNFINILGFIPREEQLLLMKNSVCIIQPSLFEGWSTVVEDAKAINKFILLSNIPIHKEQININCEFFEPLDYKTLKNKMESYLTKPPITQNYDYDICKKQFAQDILKIIENG